MKKLPFVLFICLICLTLKSDRNLYSEEVYREMYVSVAVAPAFKLSLDNANINFGFVGPGKSVELYPERNYNEVKCVSNKGNRWYLRLSVMGRITAPRGGNVTVDCFKWMITSSTGDGVVERGWHSFSETPAQAYTSGPTDMAGEEVAMRLKYRLDLPKNARGGNYGVNVVYTMSETP